MSEGKKRAIIIGVDTYEGEGFDELPYAKNDAEDVYKVLLNSEIGVFKEEDVKLLTREKVPGVTKAEIEESLETILGEAKDNDLVLIYFAGHGKLDKLFNLCLAAQNTKINRLISTSIRLETIKTMIQHSDCKCVVFIIDSCYSGAAEQAPRSTEVITNSLEQILRQGTETVIISATQAFEKAIERTDLAHGIFTHYLVNGLKEGEIDYNKDGNISVDELYNYVKENVKTDMKGKQVPGKWPEKAGAEIFIAKSIKVVRKRKAEIERLSKSARELLNEGKLDEAWDNYNKVLNLDKNTEALQEIQDLIKKIQDGLLNYQTTPENEKIETEIYNKALNILSKSYSNLIGMEKEYVRSVASLLIGLAHTNFILTWRRLEKKREPQAGGDLRPGGDLRLLKEDKALRPEAKQDPESAKKDEGERPRADAQQGGVGGQRADVPAQVFICFDDKDKEWLEKLKGTLKLFLENNKLNSWDNTQIRPGANEREEIKKALATAKFAILLVSQDFFASDSITQHELPYLLEAAEKKKLTILWVAVRDSAWKESKIEYLKPVNNPLKPLAALTPADQDSELVKICEKIENVVKPQE